MSTPTNGAVQGNATPSPVVLQANEAAKSTLSVTAEQAQIALLQAQLEALKAQLATKYSLKFKISENSNCVYGLQRNPVSLRQEQWDALLAAGEDLKKFMTKHQAESVAGAYRLVMLLIRSLLQQRVTRGRHAMNTQVTRYGKVFEMGGAWYVETLNTNGHVTLRGAIEEARKAGDIQTAFELTSKALRAGA